MKSTRFVITLITLSLAGQVLTSGAQTTAPGTILGVAGEVAGTISVSSVSPSGGCPTRVCTTNLITWSRCYTNWVWERVCTTNDNGQVQCTNNRVLITRCFTNTFPQITCTNVSLAPTAVTVREVLNGTLAVTPGCNQVSDLFPSNAVFQALLCLNLRTNDWVGTHYGSFKVLDGTNVLAAGSLSGVNGGGALSLNVPCAQCNHMSGMLRGSLRLSGPLRGARFEAAYGGDLTAVSCPSADVPQGAVTLVIDGVAVTRCALPFAIGCGDGPPQIQPREFAR